MFRAIGSAIAKFILAEDVIAIRIDLGGAPTESRVGRILDATMVSDTKVCEGEDALFSTV